VWQPSTIPIKNINAPATLTTYDRIAPVNYSVAAANCLAVFQHDNLTEHCGSVPSAIRDHHLEACIREHDRNSNATTVMLNSIIFYCVTAMQVSECKFKEYFYFCDDTPGAEETPFPMWVIGVAAGGVLLIAAVVAAILIRKWLKKRQHENDLEELDHHYTLLHNKNVNTRFNRAKLGNVNRQRETSFNFDSSRPSSSAWSDDGRMSQASVGSRFFESPIMFTIAAPMDTHVARSGSPFNIFKKHVEVKPESIAVSPIGKVPEKFKKKEDFSKVKTEGKSTFSAISKLISKARKDAGAKSAEPESPHPEPKGLQRSSLFQASPGSSPGASPPGSPTHSGTFSFTGRTVSPTTSTTGTHGFRPIV